MSTSKSGKVGGRKERRGRGIVASAFVHVRLGAAANKIMDWPTAIAIAIPSVDIGSLDRSGIVAAKRCSKWTLRSQAETHSLVAAQIFPRAQIFPMVSFGKKIVTKECEISVVIPAAQICFVLSISELQFIFGPRKWTVKRLSNRRLFCNLFLEIQNELELHKDLSRHQRMRLRQQMPL